MNELKGSDFLDELDLVSMGKPIYLKRESHAASTEWFQVQPVIARRIDRLIATLSNSEMTATWEPVGTCGEFVL